VAFPPTFDRAFDETFPPDTQLANLLGQDLRNLKTDLRERFALLAGTFANRPTNMDAAFGGAGYGVLYFTTDTGVIYQWNGAAWVAVAIQGALVVASVDALNQAASIASTNIYTSVVGGVHELSTDMLCSVAGTGNIVATFTWNNGLKVNTFSPSQFNFGGTLGSEQLGTAFSFYLGAGQTLSYSVVYTGPGSYSIRNRVKFLG
jgi:hypothetical protein